ncbi:MAG: winged helix-turn-helix transcriptional regulator [Tenericutes bacterium]|nr:winged helix-turn-helix transcriptional regulator [Mycoplasmatota bacterium]
MQRNEYDHAIHKYRHRFFREKSSGFELSGVEIPYLRKIYKANESIKMNDIVGESVYHKSHATRAINRLVKDGLVIKEKNPNDLRAYVLSVTEKGKNMAIQVGKVVKEWDDLVDTVITNEEREVLRNITKKIYHLLREYYNEEDIINEANI